MRESVHSMAKTLSTPFFNVSPEETHRNNTCVSSLAWLQHSFSALLQAPALTTPVNYLHFFVIKGDLSFIFSLLNSTLLHLPPLRSHCVGGGWDRTQESCYFFIVFIHTRLGLIHTLLDLIHCFYRLFPVRYRIYNIQNILYSAHVLVSNTQCL